MSKTVVERSWLQKRWTVPLVVCVSVLLLVASSALFGRCAAFPAIAGPDTVLLTANVCLALPAVHVHPRHHQRTLQKASKQLRGRRHGARLRRGLAPLPRQTRS